MEVNERIIVALDFPRFTPEVEDLIHKLRDEAGIKYFKIGLQITIAEGVPKMLFVLKSMGVSSFLDLKLHDIPNTVAGACRAIVEHGGAGMLNLHASGSDTMMREAFQATKEEAEKIGCPRPLVLAVTILTSLNIDDLQKVGFKVTKAYGLSESSRSPEQYKREIEALEVKQVQYIVRGLASLAKDSGLDGVVCSGWEIETVRGGCGEDFTLVVPGIRFADSNKSDQKRVMTPGLATALGANYIVMGRDITGAPDPVEAAKRAIDEINEATKGEKV